MIVVVAAAALAAAVPTAMVAMVLLDIVAETVGSAVPLVSPVR